MPARRRAAEERRRVRRARRAGQPGHVPAPSPAAVRRADEDQAWYDRKHGDACWRNCQ